MIDIEATTKWAEDLQTLPLPLEEIKSWLWTWMRSLATRFKIGKYNQYLDVEVTCDLVESDGKYGFELQARVVPNSGTHAKHPAVFLVVFVPSVFEGEIEVHTPATNLDKTHAYSAESFFGYGDRGYGGSLGSLPYGKLPELFKHLPEDSNFVLFCRQFITYWTKIPYT